MLIPLLLVHAGPATLELESDQWDAMTSMSASLALTTVLLAKPVSI